MVSRRLLMSDEYKKWVDETIEQNKKDLSEHFEAEGAGDSLFRKIIQGFTDALLWAEAFFLPGIVKFIPSGITGFTDHLKKQYSKGITRAADSLLDNLKKQGIINETGYKKLNDLLKGFGVLQSPITALIGIQLFFTHMKAVVEASTGKIMQEYNKALSPYVLDASSAARVAFIAPELYNESFDVLKRNGLSDADIKLLFTSMYKTHDAVTIREMYFRKILSPEQTRVALRETGLTDRRIDELIQTWALIPMPNDLIRMAVREAFDERKASELGLDDNPQQPFIEWADKQGLSAYWSKMYWRAHWELPSPQMGFEMLHRGIITEDELRSLLVALDYSPRWHDPLMGISYNVMTRVDVRRIFELGLINPEEMEKEYLHQGYSPKDAKLLRAWTEVEYNQEYKDITKNEVIKQFLEGIISDAQCRDMLAYMGYTAERRETMIALATYQRAYAKQTALIAALKKLYIMGEYDISRVQQELAPYNIDPRRIVELIDQWEVERKAGVAVPKKAELDRFFLEGIINEREYFTEMQRIGHAEKNIARYIKSIKIAMAKEIAEKAGGK